MARRKTDKRLEKARNMPPLVRKNFGEDYSLEKDSVAKWISDNSDLMNYFIDFLAHNGYIAFNPNSKKWEGVNE